MKKIAAASVLAALTLAACGGADQSTEDSNDLKARCGPEDQTVACLDATPKRVIAFSNQFKNVTLACDGYGHRLFETTSGHLVILPDPTCSGYVKGSEPTVIITQP